MSEFSDEFMVSPRSIFTLEMRDENLHGGKWFLSGRPPMTRKAVESMKRQYEDSKMWDGVRVVEWVRKEDAVGQTTDNTVKTGEKVMDGLTKQSRGGIDECAKRLINLAQDYMWLVKKRLVNAGPNADLLKFFRESLAEALCSMTDEGWRRVLDSEWRLEVKELMDDFRMPIPDNGIEKTEKRQTVQNSQSSGGGTADSWRVAAPEDAKRLFDLITAKAHLLDLVDGKPVGRRLDGLLLDLLDEKIEAAVGSLSDEGCACVISSVGYSYLKKILKRWGNSRQPSVKTAKRTWDAERFNGLAQMYRFLVKGRPCPRTIGNFDREYGEVMGLMTDEGWDYVLNNGPFQEIARDWRENGKPRIQAMLDCGDCGDCAHKPETKSAVNR